MIPIIIPVGSTRDQLTETYFHKKVTIQEIRNSLKNIKKHFDEEALKDTSNVNIKKLSVVNEFNENPQPILIGGQPINPITGEIVRNTIGRFAPYVPVAGEVVKQFPVVGDVIVGAVSGYARAGNMWGAVYGGITGGVFGAVKTALNVAAPGLGYGLDAAVIVLDVTGGYNTGAAAVGLAAPTPTPSPGPYRGGASYKYDAQYMTDYKNITEGVDEILEELRDLMGPIYFNEFMKDYQKLYASKSVIRERVIETEDLIILIILITHYLKKSSMDSRNNR